MLYWALRSWWPPALANLISLLMITVLNAEANRRITSRRYPIRPVRAHLAASGLFVLAYLTTSGAALIFRHFRPATVAAFRVPTSAARQASRNDLEFCQG